MRDIKFRTYVRFLREMHEVREMILDKGTVMIDAYQYGLDKDDAPVMQYTGLKDANGVDIYEGDVVEFSSHWDKHVCTVSFDKCKFGFGREIKGGLGINDDCDLVSFMNGSGCNGYTVIGNIHQHPELLEGDK